jgi:hypothetical protein
MNIPKIKCSIRRQEIDGQPAFSVYFEFSDGSSYPFSTGVTEIQAIEAAQERATELVRSLQRAHDRFAKGPTVTT